VQLSNGAAEGPRFVAYHWAIILATPFLLLAVNPNLFLIPNINIWIDAWVYTGFFLSLPEHLIRWGETYYATRLSWLLPGYAAHQTFSPLLANYIIHFGFFYLLLAAVYSLMTAAVNRTTGFITTLLVAWHPHVLAAMSWNYVDGAVITYLVVALLFLEKASSSTTRRAHWAFGAGIALACMASANLVALTLVPICGLFVFLRAPVARWSRTFVIAVIAAAGSATTLAILGVANWLLGSQWWFLKPSVTYANTRMWVPSPWDVSGSAWLADATFLSLPAVAVVAALLALYRRAAIVGSFAATVQLTFVVAVAWWIVHSYLWTHSIHLSYYGSYLVPLALIVLVTVTDTLFTTGIRRWPRHVVPLELGTLGLLIAAHILVFRRGELPWTAVSDMVAAAFPTAYRINVITAFVVACVALVVFRFAQSQWLRWPAFLLTFWIAYGSMPPYFPTVQTPHLKENFVLTVSVHRYIKEHLTATRPLAMWYALADAGRRPFRDIASSYLWGYVIFNEELPSLDESKAAAVLAGTQLVLLVRDPADIDAARAALQKFALDYTPVAQKEFGPTDAAFWVVVGDLRGPERADQ
jgi:hypothetical protein